MSLILKKKQRLFLKSWYSRKQQNWDKWKLFKTVIIEPKPKELNNKGGEFLKKLQCWDIGGYYKIVVITILVLSPELINVNVPLQKGSKSDILSVSPSILFTLKLKKLSEVASFLSFINSVDKTKLAASLPLKS